MAINVGVIGATGVMGGMVVDGLLSSPSHDFSVTSFTRISSMASAANQHLQAKGVKITGYDIFGPPEALVEQLRGTAVLISCITWAHLEQQLLWIRAAKAAGVQRFVPSEWVGPAPRGVIDIKDRKLDILAAIQRAHLPYTVIAAGCWFQVWVPRVPSGRSDHARSLFIDHRIVGDGTVRFALMDMMDIGRYVARIVADPRTINRCVLAYTEVLSMNEIWDVMANASGEEPLRDYITESQLHGIIASYRGRLAASPETTSHPTNTMDTANFNMAQYRISWCVRGENTPEYADYLGYLDFWSLFPLFRGGRRLEAFYREVLGAASS